MPIPSDYRDICILLIEATDKGRVIWTEKGAFIGVHLPDFNLEVWSGTDEESHKDFVAVGIRDSKERLVDNWFVEEGDKDFGVMRELYSKALRLTRRIPERLERLRELLKSGKIIGSDKEE